MTTKTTHKSNPLLATEWWVSPGEHDGDAYVTWLLCANGQSIGEFESREIAEHIANTHNQEQS